jgi:ABC-type multidrug transport system fused ATPase/permease subunit
LRAATIITVAHRLRTIADSDLIIVVQEGSIGEVGAPAELLNINGLFYQLAQESGEFGDIKDIAENSKRRDV